MLQVQHETGMLEWPRDDLYFNSIEGVQTTSRQTNGKAINNGRQSGDPSDS